MYTVAASVALVLETIVGSGIPLVVSRMVASNNVDHNNHKNYKIVSAGLVWCVSLSVIITLFVLVGQNFFGLIFTNYDTYIILLTMLPTILFTALYTPFKGYLWGEERYFAVSIVELIEQIVRVLVCIILFACFKQINIMLPAGIGLSVACGISTIVGIIIYYCVGGKLSSPRGEIKNVFSTTAPLTATRVAGSMMTPLINILLPFSLMAVGYSNTQVMSMMGVVVGMTIPLLYVPSAITMSLGMALIPQLSTLKRENNTLRLCNQINSSITFTIYSCILFIPLFMGLGEQICALLYNNISAGIHLSQFGWLILPMGLAQITTSILNSLGHEKTSFRYFIISSVVMLLIIVSLPKLFGISCLLIALGVGNTLTFILNMLKINKITPHKGTYIRKISLIFALCIPVAILTKFSYNLLIFIFPSIVTLLICTIISSTFIIMLLACFNLVDYEIIRNVIKKIKPNRIK